MTQFTDWKDPRINPTQVLDDLRAMALKMHPPMGPKIHLVETPCAMTATGERLFPESRHRSKHIHKKLVKRFGDERALEPGMIAYGNTVYIHPIKMQEFEKERKRRSRHD